MKLLPVIFLTLTATCFADSIFTFNGVDVNGHQENITAQFSTIGSNLQVQLWNNQADPNDPTQILYSVQFSIANVTGTASIASSSGNFITVANGGGFTSLGSAALTGWTATTTLPSITLTAWGGGQPSQGIIGGPNAGTGIYSAAGGAIAGNGPHNPFVAGSSTPATFLLSGLSGLSSESVISSVQFGFSTTPGIDIVTATPGRPTPEPATWGLVLMGTGLVAIGRRVKGFRR